MREYTFGHSAQCMCELQNWSSWSQLVMESVATREPCVPPTDAGMLFALFNLTICWMMMHGFWKKKEDTHREKMSTAFYNDTHTEHWRSMKSGMLRRLIWSIMHKSTCFNFTREAKTKQPSHRQFLSIHLSRFAQIVRFVFVRRVFGVSFCLCPKLCHSIVVARWRFLAHHVRIVCIWCTKMARKKMFVQRRTYSVHQISSH